MKEKSMATAFVCRSSMHLPQVPSLTHSFSSLSEEVLKQGRNIVQFSKAGFGKGANQETSFRERKARIICNVNYRVELLTPTGERHVLEIPNDKYILDAAQEENIELPYCCRSGACSSCAGIIVKGIVDQSEQTTLDPEQEKEGYVMMCVAYPRSDLVIETHQEGKLYIY